MKKSSIHPELREKAQQFQFAPLSTLFPSEQSVLFVPELSREAYACFKVVLSELGGTWHPRNKTHTFPSHKQAFVESVLPDILSLEVWEYNHFEFFATGHTWLSGVFAEYIAQSSFLNKEYYPWTDQKPLVRVLEPSAGDGRVVRLLQQHSHPYLHIDMVEIDPFRREALKRMENEHCTLIGEDFLSLPEDGEKYDIIFMNPPFSDWHLHVEKAYRLLKEEGEAYFILPTLTTKRTPKKPEEYRAYQIIHKYMTGWLWEDIPSGSFEGTGVGAALYHICKTHRNEGDEAQLFLNMVENTERLYHTAVHQELNPEQVRKLYRGVLQSAWVDDPMQDGALYNEIVNKLQELQDETRPHLPQFQTSGLAHRCL